MAKPLKLKLRTAEDLELLLHFARVLEPEELFAALQAATYKPVGAQKLWKRLETRVRRAVEPS